MTQQSQDDVSASGAAESTVVGPLSETQQSAWFVHCLEQDRAAPVNIVAVNLQGPLDRLALNAALAKLVARHAIFRTAYASVDGAVQARVVDVAANDGAQAAAFDVQWERCDDKRLAVDSVIDGVAQELAALDFDLSAGRVLRARCVQYAQQRHVLILAVHRIAWDRRSVASLVSDLGRAYAQALEASPSDDAEAPLYFDYARRERAAAQSPAYHEALSGLADALDGLSVTRSLLLDKPRPAVRDYRAAVVTSSLPAAQRDVLCEIAERVDCDMSVVLHAAMTSLVAAWAREKDVVTGYRGPSGLAFDTTAGIGPQPDLTLVRASLDGDPGFIDLVADISSFLQRHGPSQALAHDAVVRHISPARDLSQAPLCQVALQFESDDAPAAWTDELSAVATVRSGVFTEYDIELVARDSGHDIELTWVYASALFSEDTVRRLANSFNAFMDGIADHPNQPVSSVPLASAADLADIGRWNATDEYGDDATIIETFAAVVDEQPDSIALKMGGQHVTFAALDNMSRGLAHMLRQRGLSAGDRVGVHCAPSLAHFVGMLATLRAGGVYMPLDPVMPDSRLCKMIGEAKPRIILGQSDTLALPLEGNLHFLDLDTAVASLATAGAEVSSAGSPDEDTGLDAPCYLIFTSGSTGQPSGVFGRQRGIVNRVRWMQNAFPAAKDSVSCLRTSTSFVDHVAELFQPLLSGCPAVIVPPEARRDVSALGAILSRERVTRLTAPPSLLNAILDLTDVRAFSKLRQVVSSGEALSFSLVQHWRRRMPRARVLNIYGSTETGADSTYFDTEQLERFDVLKYFGTLDTPESFAGFKLTPDAQPSAATDIEQLKGTFSDVSLPEQPWAMGDYLAHLQSTAVRGAVDVTSQRYIGHMTSALPSFMPDMSKLISGLNQNQVKIETSRSVTFLERQVLGMMHRLFFKQSEAFYKDRVQDPFHLFGVVTSGGSVSNLTALWCARNRALLTHGATRDELTRLGANAVQQNLGFSSGVIIGSRLMHYSMRKVASLLGIGEQNIRLVPQDTNQKISMKDLRATINEARARGEYVIAVVGVAGATETGTIDPLSGMSEVAREFGIHFHVDAAWGGAFQFSPKHRAKFVGIERADSVTICSHKQLYLPQGMSICLFRDSAAPRDIAVHANYQAMEGSFDLGQFSLEGSRPANALLLHASLHLLASRGYEWLIDQSMEKATHFADLVRCSRHFELVGEPEINIVNYRFVPAALKKGPDGRYCEADNARIDEVVQALQEAQFHEGRTFVSKTKILHAKHSDRPIWVFRVVISNPLTNVADLRAVLADQIAIASSLDRAYVDTATWPGSDSRRSLEGRYEFDQRQVPIGMPIRNTHVAVLNDAMNPVPVGAPGELCIGGAGVSLGVLSGDDRKAKGFFVMPCGEHKGERFFRTGDLARWRPDGALEFLGRLDNLVNLRGFRVEPGEIELALRKLPGVREAAVVDQRRDNGSVYLVAYIVGSERSAATARSLRRDLAQELPAYMIPARFQFVDRLPTTPSGKLDRMALRAFAIDAFEDIDREAPRTPLEAALVQLWSSVLNVPAADISIDDNFFEAGGDSISALHAVLRAKENNLDLSVTQIFQNQTIRSLAELAE